MNQKNSLGLNSCFLDLKDPMQLFKVWMDEAKKTEPNDPNAVALATSNNNLPSVKYIKATDNPGFSLPTICLQHLKQICKCNYDLLTRDYY